MSGFQAGMSCASFRGLLERIRLGVLRIATNTFDRAELLAAWLGVHQHDVESRFRGCGRLTRRNDATEENGG